MDYPKFIYLNLYAQLCKSKYIFTTINYNNTSRIIYIKAIHILKYVISIKLYI